MPLLERTHLREENDIEGIYVRCPAQSGSAKERLPSSGMAEEETVGVPCLIPHGVGSGMSPSSAC